MKYLLPGRYLLLLTLMLAVSASLQSQLLHSTLLVDYDSAFTFKNLQLIPVRYKGPSAEGMDKQLFSEKAILLPEAIKRSKAKIREVIYENGADINWLHILNDTKQTLVVNSGDLLAGGKQDRMIAETKVIPAGQSDYVKVFCVEKGRWDDKVKGFGYGGAANSQIKKVMDLTGRQAEVWKEIERQFAAENKASETWPYLQLQKVAEAADTAYVNFFTQKFIDTDSSFAGFIAITSNRIINTELFASNTLFKAAFPAALSRLIHSAKNGSEPAVPLDNVKRFVDRLLESEAAQKKFVANRGQIDYYQGKVMHVIAYGD